MFEIGNSLHEARVRQGIGLQTAEVGTKIRAKYLKALEEEQFDALPAQTYVKGFLRTYADFLGLDGQLYVDEYNSRFVVGEDEGRPRRSRARPSERRSSGRFESRAVLITLAAIAVVAGLVIIAWKSGDGNKRGTLGGPAKTTVQKPATHRAPAVARLVVTAKRGNSLLEVHQNAATGRLLFQGTLLRGKSVSFAAKRLWLNVASPQNLVVRLNGHPGRIPGRKPRVVVVTVHGIDTVSVG